MKGGSLKRSFDNGRTWTGMKIIADDGDNTVGNPCPVVDRETGTICLAGLTAVSIEMGGVFGYDEVPQRAGTRSMDSNGKCQVMLSEPKLSEASALIEVDEIPNHQANKPFSRSLQRNTANGKTYLNERKDSC